MITIMIFSYLAIGVITAFLCHIVQKLGGPNFVDDSGSTFCSIIFWPFPAIILICKLVSKLFIGVHLAFDKGAEIFCNIFTGGKV